jgi:pimeloyl-ACP methyl ester carboxylesterase
MPAKPSIVFAHGLWADGSCFSKLIPTLQAEGHQVIASQHALDTVEGDVADGRIWLQPEGTREFAGDLSEQEQKLVWATQAVPDVNLFNAKVPGTAWRSKPSWYIVANHDHTVHPDLERFAAKRMGAHTYDVDSSHVRMLSQPGFVLDVIRTAANSI